jgi:ketosteroid isomerase-like protein
MDQPLADLVRRHLMAENAQDLPGTLATLHVDCHFEDLATGQVWHGHDGAAAHYRQWWTTFDVTVKRGPGQRGGWLEDGAYLAEATWHGRHVGRFLGIEPTGRPIVQPFVVSLGFKDGLMLSERFHYDLASLLRQIGADPIPSLSALQHRSPHAPLPR